MSRLDWILLGFALVLAVSALIAPAGGVGIDSRHILAAGLAATIALRGTTDTKEPA